MAGFSILTSHTLNFLSRQVVTKSAPLALQDSDWMTSPCLRTKRSLLCSMSHTLTVKSPEALAKTFAADGLNNTWPTFLRDVRQIGHAKSVVPRMAREPPDGRNVPRLVGVRVECEVVWNSPQENLSIISGGRSARLIHTFPSSDPEAIRESLNGFLSPLAPHWSLQGARYQSVSRTAAVWPLNSGRRSGSFPRSSSGMTANEPPPPASQLTAR
jgi:hypothetical protein